MEKKERKFQSFTWVDFVKPDHKERSAIQKEFNIQAPDVNDLFRRSRRSKISRYDDYAFMVLLYPVYDEKLRVLNTAELDVILRGNTIVTIRDGLLPPIKRFLEKFESDKSFSDSASQSPERFAYEMISTLLNESYLMLDHMDEDVDAIEEAIFNEQEREMVGEISIVRRNITDFRKIMQGQRATLRRLEDFITQHQEFVMNKADTFYGDLIEHATEIWNILEGLKERIEALQETNESLISFRINDTMRLLTMFSVTLLPMAVIASIFGMNAHFIPFVGQANDFWIIIGIIGLSLLVTLYFFRRNGWIK